MVNTKTRILTYGLVGAMGLGGGCAKTLDAAKSLVTTPASINASGEEPFIKGEAITIVVQNLAYTQLQTTQGVAYYSSKANPAAMVEASNATSNQGFIAFTQPMIIFPELISVSDGAFAAATTPVLTSGENGILIVIGRANDKSIVKSLSGGEALIVRQPVRADGGKAGAVSQVLKQRAEEAKKAAEAKKLEAEKPGKPQAMLPSVKDYVSAYQRDRA